MIRRDGRKRPFTHPDQATQHRPSDVVSIEGLAGGSRRVGLSVSEALLLYLVEKGSVAVDGVSLTVAALGPWGLEVAVTPHTWAVTRFGVYGAGTAVNMEVDICQVRRMVVGRARSTCRTGRVEL